MAVNGVYVVLGESSAVVALLKKARRHWQHQGGHSASLEDTDPLLRSFADLKDVLNEVSDIMDMNPLTFLSPFLDVIRSQNTNGPITEAALTAVAKFLSYGLVDASSMKASHTVESIAQAVTHTKFIGGANAGSDECVLYKILHVLRALLLSPAGRLLSNEAVCDMMQSCFRICFEQHLSEMLRKAAETTLADMTQLIFTRLPTFAEDLRHPYIRKLVMSAKGQQRRRRKPKKEKAPKEEEDEDETDSDDERDKERHIISADHPTVDADVEVVDSPKESDVLVVESTTESKESVAIEEVVEQKKETGKGDTSSSEEEVEEGGSIQVVPGDGKEESEATRAAKAAAASSTLQMPYGLPCCRELLRFLIALTNPLDRANTEQMIVLGLQLLTVALEASADHLASYVLLLPLIKNELCRALLQLLDTEKLPIFTAASRCCFLLFESVRSQLKFQLESYFAKLRAIVVSEQPRITYEQKEMALESVVQLWRIPGLVTELYLNYDCDLYCSNVFEELTKLLAENAFPVSGLKSTSLLSLDALLVVIDTIDLNCHYRRAGAIMEEPAVQEQLGCSPLHSASRALHAPVLSGFESGKRALEQPHYVDSGQTKGAVATVRCSTVQPGSTPLLRSNRHAPSVSMPPLSEVIERKKRKRIIHEATDLFNNSPKKGIEFLREKGLLDGRVESIVDWLRSNTRLDKNKIADYICNRNHTDVLEAFVKSFPFANTRLDVSLRLFLETFRLPGESPLIAMVMQHFSDCWNKANYEPFNHVDASFTLSYAVIMLNTDQHNLTARRNQPPMTFEGFKRNLSGTNGGQDFDPDMLEQIYHAIKNEEIVMPAEQTGLVKENYLWKVLLRRGESAEGDFTHAPTGWNDHDLFALTWGPAIAALSYVFDKSENEQILQKALNGYRKCASISAHYGMSDVFDNLIIHLCKFSTLMTAAELAGDDSVEQQRQRALAQVAEANGGTIAVMSPEAIAVSFGENPKAHMATKALFELVHANGDILREGWKNVLDCLLHLYRSRLLPAELTEVEDFVDEKGWVSIVRQHTQALQPSRSDGGLLSWFGIGGGADASIPRKATPDQERLIKFASSLISDCRPSSLITDSKYLTSSALNELLTALTHASGALVASADTKAISATGEEKRRRDRAGGLTEEDEDALIFFLELIVAISLENKDRLGQVWATVRRHVEWMMSRRFGRSPVVVERAVVGLLRVANRNLFRERDSVADDVLQSLAILLRLPPTALFLFSRQIAFGLHDLLRRNAANVHRREQWAVLFALLEAAGAAVCGEDAAEDAAIEAAGRGGDRNAYSDVEGEKRPLLTDRGYTSEDPSRIGAQFGSSESLASSTVDSALSLRHAPSNEWIHLSHKDAARATADALRALGGAQATAYSRGSLVLRTNLSRHEPAAFLKVADTLGFLFRDAAHVTPENFDSCVQCLRTMVEASLDGGKYAAGPLSGHAQQTLRSHTKDGEGRREGGGQRKGRSGGHQGKKELSTEVEQREEAERAKDDEKQLSQQYLQVSLQLLDSCHTLHVKAASIYAEWAQADGGQSGIDASPAAIWARVWRPLLQAIARLCGDCRRAVRAHAANYLVRAFLLTELNDLGAAEWESCFGEVLFPLLSQLLTAFSPMDPIGMEETRVRAIQMVAKIMLNHLSHLAVLPSFVTLWLRLLDYMEKYARVEGGDLLAEAVPESLKNMLLVLSSTGTFSSIPGLHEMTVGRVAPVFPALVHEVLPAQLPPTSPSSSASTSLASPEHTGLPRRVTIAPPIGAPSTNQQPPPLQQAPPTSEAPAAAVEAPTVPSTVSEEAQQPSAPIEIPEIPLTEVIVHSGAASPAASQSPPVSFHGPPPEMIRHALAEASYSAPSPPQASQSTESVATAPATAAHEPPTATQPLSPEHQAYLMQQQQFYQYGGYQYVAPEHQHMYQQQQQQAQYPSSSTVHLPIAMQTNPLQQPYGYAPSGQWPEAMVMQSQAGVHSMMNPLYSTATGMAAYQQPVVVADHQHHQHAAAPVGSAAAAAAPAGRVAVPPPTHHPYATPTPYASHPLATSPNSAFSSVAAEQQQQQSQQYQQPQERP